jgi:hypothetical protein
MGLLTSIQTKGNVPYACWQFILFLGSFRQLFNKKNPAQAQVLSICSRSRQSRAFRMNNNPSSTCYQSVECCRPRYAGLRYLPATLFPTSQVKERRINFQDEL